MGNCLSSIQHCSWRTSWRECNFLHASFLSFFLFIDLFSLFWGLAWQTDAIENDFFLKLLNLTWATIIAERPDSTHAFVLKWICSIGIGILFQAFGRHSNMFLWTWKLLRGRYLHGIITHTSFVWLCNCRFTDTTTMKIVKHHFYWSIMPLSIKAFYGRVLRPILANGNNDTSIG